MLKVPLYYEQEIESFVDDLREFHFCESTSSDWENSEKYFILGIRCAHICFE